MPNSTSPDPFTDPDLPTQPEQGESFGDILSEFEQSHAQRHEEGEGREGTVISVSSEFVFVDIGQKTEGVLPVGKLLDSVQAGDRLKVSVRGRTPEGYYDLSVIKVERPKDWSGLQKAFDEKRAVAGMVTGVVKGGLAVDVGIRAFLPASRSGARDAAEMERLVGQEIEVRIIELDTQKEDVVVDRRAVVEEDERQAREQRFGQLKSGDVVQGTVKGLTDYAAFVDVGGVDGFLHVSDISWGRVGKPADVLAPGQTVDVQVLKIDPEKKKISLGLKQLQPHPWDDAAEKYKAGDRVQGTVTRVADFGAFVELEPGVEGLIHLSEISWSKKVRKPSDVVKPGDAVEVAVLEVKPGDRRISLGLKQALGDPWADAEKKWPVGGVVEGKVISLQKFGAFVELAEGVEGMIHVGDISAEKRLNHPQDALKMGETVKAQVLEIDKGKRRLRLGIKQMQPTSLDEYLAEHNEGDVVTGRVVDATRGRARVELGQGVEASCRLSAESGESKAPEAERRVDLSALSSMLAAKWKGRAAGSEGKREAAQTGQIRSFRIVKLDRASKRIELELAS